MRILVLGQNEGLYRFLVACVSLKRLHKFELLICVPETAANADVIDLARLATKFGWRSCTTDCSENSLLDLVETFRPELLVSVLYPRRISENVLKRSETCINFHPSLLPAHRGSLTQFWAVFDGDEISGVTCHHMVAALDEGPVVDVETCALDRDTETAYSLNRKLMNCFEVLSSRVIRKFLETGGVAAGTSQVSPPTPYHFKKFPNEGVIDPEWSLDKIDRFIRAMYCPPYKGACMQTEEGGAIEVASIDEYLQALH